MSNPAQTPPVAIRLAASMRERVRVVAQAQGVRPHRVLVNAVEEYLARQESGHEEWFVAEVEAAVKEADDPATRWASNDAVKADAERQREALKARIATVAK